MFSDGSFGSFDNSVTLAAASKPMSKAFRLVSTKAYFVFSLIVSLSNSGSRGIVPVRARAPIMTMLRDSTELACNAKEVASS